MGQLSNHQAEAAVLGAIIVDVDRIEDLELQKDYFDNGFHREVYEEILAMRAAGESVDLITLCNKFPERVGDVSEMTTIYAAGNPDTWVPQLAELNRVRKLHKMFRQGIETIEQSSSEDILSEIERTVNAVEVELESDVMDLGSLVKQALEDIQAAYDRKAALSGVTAGITGLDRMTDGFQNSDMVVIGARPSVGKTAIGLHMALAAAEAGHKVGFFSAEMAVSPLIQRMITMYSGVPSGKIRTGFLSTPEFGDIYKASERLSRIQNNLFINSIPSIKIDKLVREARSMKRNQKVDIIFVDYLGMVVHDAPGRMPRWEQFLDISRRIKKLARDLDIPVVVMAQVNRDADGHRPSLAHLRDSGGIEQDSDVVMFLHPEKIEDDRSEVKPITLILAKHRNGPTGDIDVLYQPDKMRFMEVARGAS